MVRASLRSDIDSFTVHLHSQSERRSRLRAGTFDPASRGPSSDATSTSDPARWREVRRLLEEARTLANVVIVDTAPILSASVTRELCTLADAVLVVCRSGRTTVSAADRCAELLERLGANTLGVVLVGVPAGPFADYYGAPPKGIRRPLDRLGLGSKRTDAPKGGRHKAPAPVGVSSRQTPPTGSSLRPTAAQYRATSPRAPEGGREHPR